MPNNNNLYSMTAVSGYGSFTSSATSVTANVEMSLVKIDLVAGDVGLGIAPPPTVTLRTYPWGSTTNPQDTTVNLQRSTSGSPKFFAIFSFPTNRVSPALRPNQSADVNGTITVDDGNSHTLTQGSVPINVYFDPGVVLPANKQRAVTAKLAAKKNAKPKSAAKKATPKKVARAKGKSSKAAAKPKRAAKKAAKAKRPAKRPMKKASAKKAKRVVKKASRAKRKAK